MNFRDIAVRALKTAVQGALAIFTIEAFSNGLADAATWGTTALAAGTAAAAAAFSVIHNALLQWTRS